MATGSKLPTGRSRRRGAPKTGEGGPEPSTPAPRAPSGLTRAQAAAWRELWRQPVARFWVDADGVFVLRLIRLREQLDELGGEAPLGMYAAVLALERTLFLTPGARRERLKLAVAEPPAPSPNGSSSSTSSSTSRRPSARERERLLRG